MLLHASLLKQAGNSWSMPSSGESSGKRRSILPSLSWKQPQELDVLLDGEDAFVRSYSTFDEISGCGTIKFEKDTHIDDVMISFNGQTNTWVDKIASSSPSMGKSTGRHVFLRVQQPIDQNCLPEHGHALAGVTYAIPFKFVVPDRILDFTCNHRIEREDIKLHHIELPPSIGDAMLSGHGNVLMDDLAPDMSKINYSIRIAVLRRSATSRKAELIQESKGIRIVPAREEMPPVAIDSTPIDGSTKYRLRKEKNVRRGIFKLGKKQGRISAESSQPASMKLPHPSRHGDAPVSTTVTIKLRYDPASSDEQPPPLTNVASKMKAWTYFAASPWSYMPAPDNYDSWSTLHAQYPVSVELSTLSVSNVGWLKHNSGASASVSRSNSVACSSGTGEHRKKSTATMTTIDRSRSNGTQNSDSTDVESISDHSLASIHSEPTSISTSSASSAHLKDAPICSPSTTYDASLPYYTASITLPVILPISPSKPRQPSHFEHPVPSRSISVPTITTNDNPPPPPQSQTRHMSTATTASSPFPTRRPSKPTNSPSSPSKCNTFLPTFYSCLIARVYSLELTINATGAPNLNLRLPIQLSLPCVNARPSNSSTAHTLPPHPHARFTNPFSPPTNRPQPQDEAHPEPQQDSDSDEDTALPDEDEALALALDSRPTYTPLNRYRHSISHPPNDLSSVPEYEDLPPPAPSTHIPPNPTTQAVAQVADPPNPFHATIETRTQVTASLGYRTHRNGEVGLQADIPSDAPPEYSCLPARKDKEKETVEEPGLSGRAVSASASASASGSGTSGDRSAGAGAGQGRRSSIRRRLSLIP